MIFSNLQELGLDCVAWNPSVYHDLLRSGDGTAEGIVAAYFGMVRSQSASQYPCARLLHLSDQSGLQLVWWMDFTLT